MLTLLDSTFEPSAIKLIVYDLDGTLVDAFEDIWNGVNTAMAAYGLPALDYATVRGYVGEGARMLIRRCLGETCGMGVSPMIQITGETPVPHHRDRFDEVYNFYRKYYAEHPVDRARLYPGALETLDRLRAAGLRQAILTNKPDEVTHQVCRELGLEARMDGIWGERPDLPRKPDPRSLRVVLEQFGVEPGQTLYIGDGGADEAVSHAAGVRWVGITHGLLARERIETMHVAAIIDQLNELNEMLGFA